jgi:hypothetical protein
MKGKSMRDSAILAMAKDAAYYEESNPCSGMDFWELKRAEANLKEVLRFVRMAKIQAAMEIRGQNQIEINY